MGEMAWLTELEVQIIEILIKFEVYQWTNKVNSVNNFYIWPEKTCRYKFHYYFFKQKKAANS